MGRAPWKIAHIRPHHLLLGTVSLAIFSWLLISCYLDSASHCEGWIYQDFICDQYQKMTVGGELCKDLCEDGKLKMGTCQLNSKHGASVEFKVDKKVIKVKRDTFLSIVGGVRDGDTFNMPTKGTSMESFRLMVSSLVVSRLGGDDHLELVTRILDRADVNMDGKVSLAEAKSIWSLLQNSDFFISFIFQNTEFVPKIQKFCGNIFAVEEVPHTYLYDKDNPSYLRWIFANSYQWLQPSWHHRAKIVVGLLEFIMAVYQYRNAGEFYICHLDESVVGYTRRYDMRFLGVSQLLPKQTFMKVMQLRQCFSDEDCFYSKTCSSKCDISQHTCSGSLIKPNLFHACQLLREYLLYDLVGGERVELSGMLRTCRALDNNKTSADLDHAVVLNNMKTWLWNKIQNKVS
ncbi:protein FAM69B [Lingula anatina]|uniref:Protein FAM69B n=1 Tax=Lingula anatina TaxID=7574 RepID=A0A1S3K1Q8_LINAN|nr:protein FAM69B [Lingula anatina]XP_013416206.1 protein FAM69B [Lingula anatina]|eukprot:XP_013416198.1 protein FAM69B [Lingula anatina]